MTDSADTTKEEPKKAGKSFFFDFINQQLADVEKEFEEAQKLALDNINVSREERIASEKKLEETKAKKASLLEERREAIRQGRINRRAARQINRVNAQEKLAVFIAERKLKILAMQQKLSNMGATVNAVFSFDEKKGVAERIDEAQRRVQGEFETKKSDIKSELKASKEGFDTKRNDINSKTKDVKSVTLKDIRAAAKEVRKDKAALVKSESKSYNAVQNLNSLYGKRDRKKNALKTLGVVTAPANMAAKGAKAGYELGTQTAKKAKKKGLHARWVARDTARKFKSDASNKWAAGKEAFGNFCGKIKEGAANTVGNVKSSVKNIKSSLGIKSCPQSETTVARFPPQRIPSAEPGL